MVMKNVKNMKLNTKIMSAVLNTQTLRMINRLQIFML